MASLIALTTLGALASACTIGADRCTPRSVAWAPAAPPEALPEEQPTPPTPGMTWVAGYWHWDSLRYVWIPGRWVTPPPGQRWYPAEAKFDPQTGGYDVREGAFSCIE
jgi:hypothetical protein